MATANEVANTILQEVFKHEFKDFTPMRLQRIVYLVVVEYKHRSGFELITELPQAWQYGPVYKSVYHMFAGYGDETIKTYAKDAKGQSFAINNNTILNDCIDDTLKLTQKFSTVELSRFLQAGNPAWMNACEANTLKMNYKGTVRVIDLFA